MAKPLNIRQTYIDKFDPKDYLQTFYMKGEGMLFGEWTDFALQNLHDTFNKDGVRGDTLLDFGTGPTIYQLLSACEVFDKIILSDFLEQNHAEIRKWLKKDPDAFDWTHVIKHVCKLEGNREDYEQKAETLRSKVKEVLKCDAMKRNPYDPVVVPPVDCLLSSICLDTICKDANALCNVLKNFQDLIKPGGHLIILSGLNATFYYIGEDRLPSMKADTNELEMAFKEAGFLIEKAVYAPRLDKSRLDIVDYDTNYFIHARKPK